MGGDGWGTDPTLDCLRPNSALCRRYTHVYYIFILRTAQVGVITHLLLNKNQT